MTDRDPKLLIDFIKEDLEAIVERLQEYLKKAEKQGIAEKINKLLEQEVKEDVKSECGGISPLIYLQQKAKLYAYLYVLQFIDSKLPLKIGKERKFRVIDQARGYYKDIGNIFKK